MIMSENDPRNSINELKQQRLKCSSLKVSLSDKAQAAWEFVLKPCGITVHHLTILITLFHKAVIQQTLVGESLVRQEKPLIDFQLLPFNHFVATGCL